VDRSITRLRDLSDQPEPVAIRDHATTQPITTAGPAEQSPSTSDSAAKTSSILTTPPGASPTLAATDPAQRNEDEPSDRDKPGVLIEGHGNVAVIGSRTPGDQHGAQPSPARGYVPADDNPAIPSSEAVGTQLPASSSELSPHEWGCVLAGTILLSISIFDCLIPWRGHYLGWRSVYMDDPVARAVTWAVILGTIPGIALLVVGRGRTHPDKTMSGCALVSLGLLTLISMGLPYTSFFQREAAAIFGAVFAVVGLLLILIPMRRARTSGFARVALLFGGALLTLFFIDAVVLSAPGFWGVDDCQFHFLIGLVFTDPSLHWCSVWHHAGVLLQIIGAAVGLVLIGTGVMARISTSRSRGLSGRRQSPH